MKKIEIVIGENRTTAVMLENKAPKTCEAIWKALPMKSTINHAKIAGSEIFWMTPLILEQENQTVKQEAGNIAYWPDRQMICIFYDDSPGVGAVTLFAKIKDGIEEIKKAGSRNWVKQGEVVSIRRLD